MDKDTGIPNKSESQDSRKGIFLHRTKTKQKKNKLKKTFRQGVFRNKTKG